MDDQNKMQEEEACWVILESERLANLPVVEVVITIEALVVEVQA